MSTPQNSLNIRSDLFDIESRPNGYTSYYWDIHHPLKNESWPVKDYEVTFQCHQAVLNEISTKPSNFGYGLGVALRNTFNSIHRAYKSLKSSLLENKGSCIPTDQASETRLNAMEECLDATKELSERLVTLERAEQAQYQCLVQSGSTPAQARRLQVNQQPNGYNSHETHFGSAWGAYYRDRGINNCLEETAARRDAAFAAERAENVHRQACN